MKKINEKVILILLSVLLLSNVLLTVNAIRMNNELEQQKQINIEILDMLEDSEYSNDKVNNSNDNKEVGSNDIDKENKKFALALKDINNDPWELIKQDVQLDDIVSGEVVRIIEKGAIVKIREGVDAFLPISELSEERVIKVSSVVNIGDTVNAMVIEFKPKNRRMVLSIKEANREPEEDYSEYLETEDSLGSLGELFKDKFKNLQK